MEIIQIKFPDFKLESGNGWLYRLYFKSEPVYIGITIKEHPMNRIGAHFGNKAFDCFTVEQHKIEVLADVEIDEIKKHRPKYNIVGNTNNGIKQWIQQNSLQSNVVDKGPYKKTEALNYCTLYLNKLGFFLTPKQRELLFKQLPKWVWSENGVYEKGDLDDLIRKIQCGIHSL